MIRDGSFFRGDHNGYFTVVAADFDGRYRPRFKPRIPKPSRPSPMAIRLMEMLSLSNYVRADLLSPRKIDRAVELLKSAKMVCYSETRKIWAPDVGTYDWLVKQRERMTNAARL